MLIIGSFNIFQVIGDGDLKNQVSDMNKVKTSSEKR